MREAPAHVEHMLLTAIAAGISGDDRHTVTLEDIAAPAYMTDARGFITAYNAACVEFAGRTPNIGHDRWCVTWKLYTDDGRSLPQDECPMAIALQTKLPIRNMTAVAERPDGTRISFLPYPTPLLGRDGEVISGINLLIEIAEPEENPEAPCRAPNVVPFPAVSAQLIPEDSLRLLRLFFKIRSKYSRNQLIQIVEAFVKRLRN